MHVSLHNGQYRGIWNLGIFQLDKLRNEITKCHSIRSIKAIILGQDTSLQNLNKPWNFIERTFVLFRSVPYQIF